MPERFAYNVFLSHSSQDKPKVRLLATALRDAGLRVWFDEWIITPGTDIYAAIEDGLEHSRTLILCMSRAAFDSDWVQLERGTAIFRDPQNKERRFVPVLLEDCRIRDTIRRFAYVDWRSESDEALAKLVEACRAGGTETKVIGKGSRKKPAEKIAEMPGHGLEITSISLSSDGLYALTSSEDCTLRYWDLNKKACIHTLRRHEGRVRSCALSPDGKWAISSAASGVPLIAWDVSTGRVTRELVDVDEWDSIYTVSILPDNQRFIFGGRDKDIQVWDIQKMQIVKVLRGHKNDVYSIAVSKDGSRAISGSGDKTIILWDINNGSPVKILTGHSNAITSVAISSNGALAISGSIDETVRLWDLASCRCFAILEGHLGPIQSVAISPDSRLCASVSYDGTRIWGIPSGKLLFEIESSVSFVCFAPDSTKLLSGYYDEESSEGDALAIWKLKLPSLSKNKEHLTNFLSSLRPVRYTNAKVVLLGESGVGKSGLANRLTTDHYEHTESTHGMRVERVALPIHTEDGIDREVWLWDLAGQEDYRLIHQLFLDETAVAMMVINPQSNDPFDGVGDWLKALRTALKDAQHDPVKLLIAARTDVGGMKVSNEKIERFLQENGFTAQLSTSAKTGENCSDAANGGQASTLKKLLAQYIPWDRLPFVATDRLLRELKNAVLQRAARADASIVRFPELCQQMEQAFPDEFIEPADVRKAVRLLGNQGVILPLDFGDLILLRPAEMNNYAAAVIRAARNHIDQIGCVPERDVLEAQFNLTGVQRMEQADELLLLRAMVQMFLTRSLCMAEETTDGRQLIFPSQFRRDRPISKFPETIVTYTFSGELPTIFTTLIVRLWYSQGFRNREIWQNAAEFLTPGDSKIGFVMEKIGEGTARISVFAEHAVSDELQAVFIEYVHQYLQKNTVDLLRERRYVCANLKCGKSVTDAAAVRARLAAGKTFIVCNYCDKRVPLIDAIERRAQSDSVARKVREMDETATAQLDNQAREQILIGHMMAICGEANQIFRPTTFFDFGIDGEVEFKGNDGNASGKKIYVQLKSGDSFLRRRRRDNRVIFDIQNERHIEYWQQQPCDVYLVIRTSEGEIQWMNLTSYLKSLPNKQSRQIEFTGERLNAFTLMRMRDKVIPLGGV